MIVCAFKGCFAAPSPGLHKLLKRDVDATKKDNNQDPNVCQCCESLLNLLEQFAGEVELTGEQVDDLAKHFQLAVLFTKKKAKLAEVCGGCSNFPLLFVCPFFVTNH